MTEEKQLAPWKQAITAAKDRFETLAEAHKEVNWPAEINFAQQAFQKNPMLTECTKESIRNAVINVGAIGLTLSPAQKVAFLVPRKRKMYIDGENQYVQECHLDISYQGMIKLATATGACAYVRADVVREGDEFIYHGPAAAPEINIRDPFGSDREKIIGAYAIARLASGETLCEIMRPEEIKAAEDTSKANYGPWKGPFRSEMIKKTVVKRLCKTIPPSQGSARLNEAIHVVNEHEGIETDAPRVESTLKHTPEQGQLYMDAFNAREGMALLKYETEWDAETKMSVFRLVAENAGRGQKQAQRNLCGELVKGAETELHAITTEIQKAFDADDMTRVLEAVEGNEQHWEFFMDNCPNEVAQWANEQKEAA